MLLKTKNKGENTPRGTLTFYFISHKLLIFALSCSLRLLLALYAGLLIMLSLTELGKNTGLNALSLKTTKCAVKSFILFYSNLCHLYFPSLRFAKR